MTDIDVLLQENRKFEPPPEFRRTANVSSPDILEKVARDPEKFWAEQARELEWIKPWDKVLEWTPPHAKWFTGGKINVSANCLDRHIRGPRKNKAALLSLLLPVQRAAKESALVRALVDSGEVYHPLAWTPREAHAFLPPDGVNVYDLLRHDTLVLSKDAAKALEQRCLGAAVSAAKARGAQ